MARTLSSVEQEPAPYLIRGLRSPDRDNRGLGTHSYDSSHAPSSSSFMTRFGNTLLERNDLPAAFHRFALPTVAGKDLNPYEDRIQTHLIMLIPYNLDGVLMSLDELGAFGQYLLEPHIADRLKQRTCVSRKPWYAFHETPSMSRILRPKILCKDIARRPTFWVDRSGATVPRHSTYN